VTNLPTLRQLMDTEFVTLAPDTSVSEAIGILLQNRITGAPVVDADGQVVGLLTERDCLQHLLESAYESMPTRRVADYMLTENYTVGPDIDLFKIAEMFVKQPNRRYLVVDDGQLIGQVTRRDLLRAIHKFSK